MTQSIWVPSKFDPKPASPAERFWILFSPPGWEILPFFALIVPGTLLEYAAFRGYGVAGAIGLLVWAPILWLLLVALHRAGRVRIWLSTPIFLLAHLAILDSWSLARSDHVNTAMTERLR
jgi:hypothetical protein